MVITQAHTARYGIPLDEEAVKVVSQSPKWTPGYVGGKSVRVTYIFPVIFKISTMRACLRSSPGSSATESMWSCSSYFRLISRGYPSGWHVFIFIFIFIFVCRRGKTDNRIKLWKKSSTLNTMKPYSKSRRLFYGVRPRRSLG